MQKVYNKHKHDHFLQQHPQGYFQTNIFIFCEYYKKIKWQKSERVLFATDFSSNQMKEGRSNCTCGVLILIIKVQEVKRFPVKQL